MLRTVSEIVDHILINNRFGKYCLLFCIAFTYEHDDKKESNHSFTHNVHTVYMMMIKFPKIKVTHLITEVVVRIGCHLSLDVWLPPFYSGDRAKLKMMMTRITTYLSYLVESICAFRFYSLFSCRTQTNAGVSSCVCLCVV